MNTTSNVSWGFVRQVVLATSDPEGDGAMLRSAYGLPAGFTDPELAEHGIADMTIPVGPEQFLEIIAPASPASPLTNWLARLGGRAGYGVAVQVPDMTSIRERAVGAGVRIMIDQTARGHRIMQLHPSDMGMLLDLDEAADRQWWFWDEISEGPAADAAVDAVLAIEIGVADPAVMAARWAAVVGVELLSPTSVDLDTTVHFVEAERNGLRGVTLREAPGHDHIPDAEWFGVRFSHRPA
ncbi:MAG: hypothetical protein ABIR32_05835 [Ilumatobacteraceae bacterium]